MPITPEDLARFRRMKAGAPAAPNPRAYRDRDRRDNEPDAKERAGIEARAAAMRVAKEAEIAMGGPVTRPEYDRTRPHGRHTADDPIPIGKDRDMFEIEWEAKPERESKVRPDDRVEPASEPEAEPPAGRICPECGGPLAAKVNRCYRCKPARVNTRMSPVETGHSVNGKPAAAPVSEPEPSPAATGSVMPSHDAVLEPFRAVVAALVPLRPEDRMCVLELVQVVVAELDRP